MNASAVVTQMQNHAQLAAQAASRALEAVTKAGEGAPSQAALEAKQFASQAAQTWEQALAYAKQAKGEAAATSRVIDAVDKVTRRGSAAYSKEINRIQIPPPIFPSRDR